jgi:HK97 family phage major capsid protein
MKIEDLKPNAEQFKDFYSRQAVIQTERAEGEEGFSNVVATEQPVIVFDWYRWEPIREILLMDGANIPSNNQVPLLDAHSRFSTADIKGSTRELRKEKKQILGRTFISKTAEKERTLVEEGHLTDTSIGYKTYNEHSVVLKPGEATEIKGAQFRNDYGDKIDLVIRTKWDLKENSLVPIGADDMAKFRSQFGSNDDKTFKIDPSGNIEEQLKTISKESNIRILINNEQTREPEMENQITQEQLDAAVNAAKTEGAKAENERIVDLRSMAKRYSKFLPGANLVDAAEEHIQKQKSVDEFRDFCESKMEDPTALAKPKDFIDAEKPEVEKYSISKAFRAFMDPSFRSKAGREIEMSNQVASQLGKDPEGIYIPFEGLIKKHAYSAVDLRELRAAYGLFDPLSRFGSRDLTAGGSTSGAELVGTDHLAGQFIELLRNKALLVRLGARYLPGLTGNVDIPKLAAGATFGWSATEGAGASESTQTTGSLTMSPKEGSANVDVTRQLLLQGTPAADALITDDLLAVIGLGIDLGGFHGAGSSGAPTGIAGTSGIGTVTIASMDWDAAVEFEADIDAANAMVENMAFVTTPAVRATLKSRAKESGYPVYICEKNMANDYPMYTTNQISTGYIFFGDFSQVFIGEWGGLDVQKYVAPRTGIVTFTAFKTIDIGVRQPGAFSVGSSFS